MQTLMDILNRQCPNLGECIANALNESMYNSNVEKSLSNDIRKMIFFKELGCELEAAQHKLTIFFPEGTECPDEIINFVNKIKNDTSKGLHSISGYFSPMAKQTSVNGKQFIFQGTITFHYLLNKNSSNIKSNTVLYHVCSGKNVESIRKNGLVLNTAKFVKNDNVKNGKAKDYFGFMVYTYKALFAIYKKADCKHIAKDLEIQDPYIVAFKPGNTKWCDDSLMNNAYENKVTSSVYSFDDIKPEQIIDISKMK